MQLKPLEAGRYDDTSIVVRNPETGKQELFTEEEFEMVRFLKQNQNETLLAMLLPNIGVAKKAHILLCIRTISKLKRMGIVDYAGITGKKPISNTQTVEVEYTKEKIRFEGLHAMAALIFGVSGKFLALLGAFPVFLLTLAAAVCGFLFFPADKIESALREGLFSYTAFFLGFYLTLTLTFSIRRVLQAAFIRSAGKAEDRKLDVRDEHFTMHGPIFALEGDVSDVNILGIRQRMQMGLLGLMSPLAISGVISLLALGFARLFPAKVFFIDPFTHFVIHSACVSTFLFLLCPMLDFDAADLLHLLFIRKPLKQLISVGLKELFFTKGALSKVMLISLLATFVWLLVWLDTLRAFWEMVSGAVMNDFYGGQGKAAQWGAYFFVGVLMLAMVSPLLIYVTGYLQRRAARGRKALKVKPSGEAQPLGFDEQMAALEKIPLFALLNDQERLALFNEMQCVFYKDNDYIVHQGEIGKEFYVLVKGKAQAYFTDVKGEMFPLAELQEGDAFGEIALIDDVPRTASIVSEGGCFVLVLKKDGFDRFLAALGSGDRVKQMIRLTSFFRRHPLFSKLTAKEQADLIEAFRFETITAGDEIRAPDGEERFYLIYSGKVRMDTGDDSADSILESDDCFGYANALNAHYVAQEGAGLLSIAYDEFLSLIWQKMVAKPELFV